MWSLACSDRLKLCSSATADYRDPDLAKRCPHSNFLKACQWCPDGTCLLTSSDDNVFRVFPLPSTVAAEALSYEGNSESCSQSGYEAQLRPTSVIEQGESVYDMDWYPACNCLDAESACFASTSRGHPVHLWDLQTGKARTTYRTYNNVDEVTAAFCLKFHPDCARLAGGLKKKIVFWDLSRPGRETMAIDTGGGPWAQKGIVSCLAFSPLGELVAAGAFSSDVAVYDSRSGDMTVLLEGHSGGVTHVQFSRCGNFVYSGARHDAAIYCWDVRSTGACVYALPRADAAATNQRLAFDIEPCGRHLLAGTTAGMLQMFDLADGRECAQVRVADDTVGGVSVHPFVPLVATASGHRRFPEQDSGSDSESDALEGGAQGPADPLRALGAQENRLAIWAVASVVVDEQEPEAHAEAGGEGAVS